MAVSPDTVSMAMFCDFENVALGVRDANYEKFDIKPVLERLLLKGSIVLKKAYCDWDRYKGFKATMHEANFELIEIPHVRQSGKNSADIRMVVDALDLCYTKSHVNTFVIISGDSDFSPLVSKLRENAKYVIGVGVKQSTSDLLIANCDEFIFYDDLVRERERSAARRDKSAPAAVKRSPEEDKRRKDESEAKKSEAIEVALETFEALVAERGDTGKIWASMLKSAIKRRKPDFNESYYGFKTFGNLLEEAQARGLLELGRDEKSGAFISRSSAPTVRQDAAVHSEGTMLPATPVSLAAAAGATAKRRGRGRSKNASGERSEAWLPSREQSIAAQRAERAEREVAPEQPVASEAAANADAASESPLTPTKRHARSRGKGGTKPRTAENGNAENAENVAPVARAASAPAASHREAAPLVEQPPADASRADPGAPAKAPSRPRRPRSPKAVPVATS